MSACLCVGRECGKPQGDERDEDVEVGGGSDAG